MKKPFLFLFYHPSDSSLVYAASFTSPDKLRVEKTKKDGITNPVLESFEGEKAWRIFYQYAAIEDIFHGRMEEDEDYSDIKNLTEYLLHLPLKNFLERIGKYPFLLDIDEVKRRFVAALSRAGRPDNKIKGILRKHLIPKHPGGGNPNVGCPSRRALITRLCRHLSEMCRDFLKEKGLWTDEKDALTFEWEENYRALQEGLHDKRIRLTSSDLHELISNPSNYAFQILRPFYPNLSKRSFYRK